MVSTGSCYSVNKMPNNTNEGAGVKEKPAFRDVRRYYCQYCGICRSKKNLIRSHIVASHKFELEDTQSDEVEGINKVDRVMQHACQECGASFCKPAHMKQHMLSHCIEFWTHWICLVYLAGQLKMYKSWAIETCLILREALDPMRRTPKCKEAL